MCTRIIQFTPTGDRRKTEVVLYASASGRTLPRQVVRQASHASAVRLIRLLSRLLEASPTTMDVFLDLDGWSVVVKGRV